MEIKNIKSWDYRSGWGSLESQVLNEMNEYIEELRLNCLLYEVIVTPRTFGAVYSVVLK